MKGLFISFEGIDGTGKTTQATMLAKSLTAMGREVIHTREPGGTALGSTLRTLLLTRDSHMFPETELLLLAADRSQHVQEVIRPGLSRGAVVITERYADSSMAYQGAAGVDESTIAAINNFATRGLMPHLTFLFDMDPTQTWRAAEADRIEKRDETYHRMVRDNFLRLKRADPQRVHLIAVHGMSPEAIHHNVLDTVQRALTHM